MRRILTLVAGGALVAALAGRVLSYPDDDGGPFGEGHSPRVFRIHPCAVADHSESAEPGGAVAAVFTRSDRAERSARMLLASSAGSPGLRMTVMDSQGNVLAGPEEIAGAPEAMFAFWADLNGDGREDFVALVWSAKSGSNLGFALSSKDAYAITSVMTTDPASTDFVNLGDGKCRLVQTALVRSPAPGSSGRPDVDSREFRVYNLMEFDGDRLVVSRADKRFPKWVSRPRGKGKARAAELSADERSRLWAAVPERIFWRPQRSALSEKSDTAPAERATSPEQRGASPSPAAKAPVLASAGD